MQHAGRMSTEKKEKANPLTFLRYYKKKIMNDANCHLKPKEGIRPISELLNI